VDSRTGRAALAPFLVAESAASLEVSDEVSTCGTAPEVGVGVALDAGTAATSADGSVVTAGDTALMLGSTLLLDEDAEFSQFPPVVPFKQTRRLAPFPQNIPKFVPRKALRSLIKNIIAKKIC